MNTANEIALFIACNQRVSLFIQKIYKIYKIINSAIEITLYNQKVSLFIFVNN